MRLCSLQTGQSFSTIDRSVPITEEDVGQSTRYLLSLFTSRGFFWMLGSPGLCGILRLALIIDTVTRLDIFLCKTKSRFTFSGRCFRHVQVVSITSLPLPHNHHDHLPTLSPLKYISLR
jgi:hypothetical protein